MKHSTRPFTQPALFAFEVAGLAWSSWGIKPAYVLGHSIGELSAAYVAGVFSLEDAARLVTARAEGMQSCISGGVMASVQAGEAEIEEAIAAYGDSISIAGLNSVLQTVISGDPEPVREVVEHFKQAGCRVTGSRFPTLSTAIIWTACSMITARWSKV